MNEKGNRYAIAALKDKLASLWHAEAHRGTGGAAAQSAQQGCASEIYSGVLPAMSLSNWRYQLALAWLAPFLILVGFAMGHLISGGDLLYCKQTHASSSKSAQNQEPTPAPSTIGDKKDCRDQGTQRDSACQGWRQAEAAEDQACVTRRQFYAGTFIGVMGLLGLMLTVVFTAQAASGAIQAAKAAGASAATADKTLKVMQDTGERQLRAYVCLESGGVTLVRVPGQTSATALEINASVVFRNSGQTPGYRVMTWIRLEVESIRATPFLADPPDPNRNDPRSIIAPQGDVHTACSRALTVDELRAIEAGEKAIFFWGGVEYGDAFDSVPRYFIFNCRMSGRPHKVRDKNTGDTFQGWALMAHPAGYKAN
jgi:hypothetical protein